MLSSFIVETGYFIAALTFIFSLKRMSHPSTARSGIVYAGIAMLMAVIVSFIHPDLLPVAGAGYGDYFVDLAWIIAALAVGGAISYRAAKKVAMTDMPQMIAIFNGVGGGSAAGIGAIALLQGVNTSSSIILLAAIGSLIGSISFTGSIVAWAKLDGRMNKPIRLPSRNVVNFAILGCALVMILIMANQSIVNGVLTESPAAWFIFLFFLLALAYGFLIAVPIGGADMPVVISLFNALTGLAVAFEGIALGNAGLIIAGMVVGAAGTLLTQLMAKAMNRSLANVLFSNFGDVQAGSEAIEGSMKPIEASDAAISMSFDQSVIIIPGYGLAVAQAQHKVAELTKLLQDKGIEVKFAIHPVAGRMPGHMNVLLAEAGIPYDLIFDLDEINDDFANTDAVIVIGANDVVNPAARTDKSSPIYGMPILNADMAKQVYIIKRGQGTGFSGIENHLFYLDNTNMIYGDAQKVVSDMITALKTV